MTLRDAIVRANQELDAARLEQLPTKTTDIFEALDDEPVVDALARSLFFSLAELVTRRPEMVNVIARQYLAIGIWIGSRAKELLDEKPKADGHPM
jgi:hypothetical protein